MSKATIDYRNAVQLLRHSFGVRAFPASRGYGLRKQTDTARRWMRRHRGLISELKRLQAYPHKTLSGAQARRAQSSAPSQLVVIRSGRKRALPWVHIPIVVSEEKSRLRVSEKGRVSVRDRNAVRWFHPFGGAERMAFVRDPYGFALALMRSQKAEYVTFQIFGNIVGDAYSREEIASKGRGRFGRMLEHYLTQERNDFLHGVSGAWLFSHAARWEDFGQLISKARREWRESIHTQRNNLRHARARQSRRARLTGRQ